MKKILFSVKQLSKMILQHVVLPSVYGFWRIIYASKNQELIIFADAHHDEIPQSMIYMYKEVKKRGYQVVEVFHDYGKISQLKSFYYAIRFMKLYAQAKVIFICDNFLPVSSCLKNKKIKVIQLWHSCGLLKKMGYDTYDDIPKHYVGHVYKNYDVVTVSAPCCVKPLTSAMKQPEGVVQALGVSRTDRYYDEEWIRSCRTEFYKMYPEAKSKKIILWAPTFRGNAGKPYQVGTAAILKLEQLLGEEYFVIRKVHPHIEQKEKLSNCPISSENLLPVVDLMITDYSSILFDYLFFKKPYVLFAPDLEDYVGTRGFYVSYDSLTPFVVTKEEHLEASVRDAIKSDDSDWIQKNFEYHLGMCDGTSTKRILDYIGL